MNYKYTQEELELLSNKDDEGGQLLNRWEDQVGFKRGRTLHRSPTFYDEFAQDIAAWTEENEAEEAIDAIEIHRYLLINTAYAGEIDEELQELITELRAAETSDSE